MANYYFIGTLLPDLRIGQPPEISFEELDELLHDNLNARDFQKTQVLRTYYDFENFRSLWKKEELDPRANMDEQEVEEAILRGQNLPEYAIDFLDQYKTKETRLQHFPALLASYFREESKKASGFLKRLLTFEREWRLIQTVYRAKRLGRDVALELQYDDPQEPFIQQLLMQKDAKGFEPPEGYEDLKVIFDKYYDSPLDLHKAITEYRFDKIGEMIDYSVFSIDRILGYMIQLILVEKWQELNQEKGTKIVDSYIKEKT